MSDNEKSLFWICVILTMGMAFTALMISLPRTVDISNSTRLDYQGTIVAIFALLVTVLIGWQIYTLIDINKREEKNASRIVELDRILAKSKVEEAYRRYLAHYAIADIYAHMCNGLVVEKKDYECAKNRLEALYDASILEDWGLCQRIANIAARFIKQRKTKFSSLEKEELMEIALSSSGQNFTKEFSDLLMAIQSIDT